METQKLQETQKTQETQETHELQNEDDLQNLNEDQGSNQRIMIRDILSIFYFSGHIFSFPVRKS